MKFPEHILEKAFVMGKEYAWEKQDLPAVLEYLIQARVAVIGCEVWIIRHINDVKADEPSHKSHHSDPAKRQKGLVLAQSGDYVVYGVIPTNDGKLAVLGWDTQPRSELQSWSEYVQDTIETSRKILDESNYEAEIIPEYSPYVFYNLLFKTQEGD